MTINKTILTSNIYKINRIKNNICLCTFKLCLQYNIKYRKNQEESFVKIRHIFLTIFK